VCHGGTDAGEAQSVSSRARVWVHQTTQGAAPASVPQTAPRRAIDLARLALMGHSRGGECAARRQPSTA